MDSSSVSSTSKGPSSSAATASVNESIGRGAAAVILAAAFVACFLSAGAWVESRHATEDTRRVEITNRENSDRVAREYKQIQVQLMYTNALMIREGMVHPGDLVFGPEGNLEYDGSKFKRKE